MKDAKWWNDFYIIEWLERTKAPTAYKVMGVMGENYVTARQTFDSDGRFVERRHDEASSDFPARHFSVTDIEGSGDKITLHVSKMDACVNLLDMRDVAKRAAKAPRPAKPEPVNDNADESQTVTDDFMLARHGGDYSEATTSVLRILVEANGKPVRPSDIARLINRSDKDVHTRLAMLKRAGKVAKVRRGQWVSTLTQSSANVETESQSVPDHVKLDMEIAGREWLVKAVAEIRKAGGRIRAYDLRIALGIDDHKARRLAYALGELGYGEIGLYGTITLFKRYMGPEFEDLYNVAS